MLHWRDLTLLFYDEPILYGSSVCYWSFFGWQVARTPWLVFLNMMLMKGKICYADCCYTLRIQGHLETATRFLQS